MRPIEAVRAAVLILGASAVAGVSCKQGSGDHVEVDGSSCITCHRAEFLRAEEPPHVDALPMTCGDCHSEEQWTPSTFDHSHHFRLTGVHADAACTSCHTQGFEPGRTPSECVDCHRDDYDASPLPGHDQFPTTCVDCHATTGWRPAIGGAIDDHDRFFPLAGAHATTECASCHTQGFEPGQTPTECVGCHRNDYDSSPYPGHGEFPTTCADCHGTSAWTPASGGHPENRFPIAAGKHDEYACADCHNASLGANWRDNADCVGCHDEGVHSRAKMDEAHKEESGYPRGDAPPNFCLDCHPSGDKD